MNELNTTLREEAIKLGLCQQWQGMWAKDWDKDTMLRMFTRGLDFCLDNRYPGLCVLEDNFDKQMLRRHGVLVNDKYSFLNMSNCMLFGGSRSSIRYDSHYIGNVWLCDNSNAVIMARGRADVVVHVVDKGVILSVSTQDRASITVVFHDEGCLPVVQNGNVKFRNELGLFQHRHQI